MLHPVLRLAPSAREDTARSPEARLDEAVGLAQAIKLDIVAADVVRVARWRPSTLIGSGAVESYAAVVRDGEVAVAVIDAAVTPVQQRNL